MRRILTRLPLLLLVVVGLVTAGCSDRAELGGPTVGGALAASIGSYQYTTSDLEAEIETWASDETMAQQAFGLSDLGAPGRRNADFVAAVLSFRVIAQQSRQLGAATGFTPAPDQVSQAVDQLKANFSNYDDAFLTALAEDLLYQQNLSSIDPSTVDVPDVVVNPRYGTFRDQGSGIGVVDPPSGPRPQPNPTGP